MPSCAAKARLPSSGQIAHIVGGLCGLVLSDYLTTAGDFAALSPLYMLAFLVLLLLPTLLLSGLVKYY